MPDLLSGVSHYVLVHPRELIDDWGNKDGAAICDEKIVEEQTFSIPHMVRSTYRNISWNPIMKPVFFLSSKPIEQQKLPSSARVHKVSSIVSPLLFRMRMLDDFLPIETRKDHPL